MDTITKTLLDTQVFANQAPFYANNILFSAIVLAGINLLNVIPKNFSPFSESEQQDNEKVVKPFNRFFVVLLVASIIGYSFAYMNAVGMPGTFMRTATSGIPGVFIFTGILTLIVYQVSLFTADVENKESTKKAYQNMGFSMVFIFVLFTFLSGFGPIRQMLNSLLSTIVKPSMN
jgi:hypothetical protein